jgi:hypothetical protein
MGRPVLCAPHDAGLAIAVGEHIYVISKQPE